MNSNPSYMHKFLLIWAFIGIAASSMAQNQPAADSAATNSKEKEAPISVVLNLNHTRLLDLQKSVDQKLLSRGLDVSLHYEFSIVSNRFSFAPGIGFSTGNYFIDGDILQSTDSNGVKTSAIEPFADEFSFKRHKLSTNYVEVPLEFRYQTAKNSAGATYKVAVGFKAGYMVNVHTKTVTSDGRFKAFIFDDVSSFRYGPTVRMAYGRFGFSGFYSLATLFEDGKGADITPIAIGFTLLPY